MGNRRRAREAAVQMLYQMDQSGLDAEQAIRLFWENLDSANTDGRELADELVRGYAAERDAVDARIREVSRHWRLERMARVDRNILRLATYELMRRDDIPPRVSLNEAVELAKRFGDEDSPAFVNGILDRIAGLR